MAVPESIRGLRISLGLQQDEFGKLLNVSKGTVSNWENGRRVPRLPKLKIMVDIAKKNKIKLTMQDFFK